MKTAKFKLASRLGILRDTFNMPDPFGTGATFTILRAGSDELQAWAQSYIDTDPATQFDLEMSLSDNSFAGILLPDEQMIVDDLRKSTEVGVTRLIPVIDRLTSTAGFAAGRREAMKSAITSGRLKPAEYFKRNQVMRWAEAVKTIKGWSNMPGMDDDGDDILIEFLQENVEALITNNTPVEENGPLAEIVKGIPELYDENKETGVRTFAADLTLGEAYTRIFLSKSADRDNFRAKVMEEAAKNSEPPSVLTN